MMQTQRLLWIAKAKPAFAGFKRQSLLRVLGRAQQIYTKRAFSFNKLLNENALFKINYFFILLMRFPILG